MAPARTARDDLVEMSDYAWSRVRGRLEGLTDEEYRWEPVPHCRTVRQMPDGSYRSDGPAEPGDRNQFTSLSWRLCHIADFLGEERNGPWLGLPVAQLPPRGGDPGSAADVLAVLDRTAGSWHGLLAETTEESLSLSIGPIAGHYAESTRRSFAHHVVDELIHHGAETMLLRDLYAATPGRWD
jgi:hypothetical protein